MKLLALDCAGLGCSVALWRDGSIAAEQVREMVRGHAEALMPMIDEVMVAADERLDTLDRLAVTVGPGSFTGIRVGLAAARGLALAIGCPVIGVGTLEALAEGTDPAERVNHTVLAVLDARRGEVYAQAFDERLAPMTTPQTCPASEALAGLVPPILLVGSGSILIAAAHEGTRLARAGAPEFPEASRVAALAARQDDRARPGHDVAPLYLRGPGAHTPDASPSG